MPQDRYSSFAQLAAHEKEGIDYTITAIRRLSSAVAVIAPHGGKIEVGTTVITQAIAGDEFNLYLFEGIKASGNYVALHITSNLFDEPSCLELIRECLFVVSIHGYTGNNECDEMILLGGLDAELKDRIAEVLRKAHFPVKTADHAFMAIDPNNICNRGKTRKGVQIEIPRLLRTSENKTHFIQAVRAALLPFNVADSHTSMTLVERVAD